MWKLIIISFEKLCSVQKKLGNTNVVFNWVDYSIICANIRKNK